MILLLLHHAHHVVWVGRRGSGRSLSATPRTTFTRTRMLKRHAVYGIDQVTVETSCACHVLCIDCAVALSCIQKQKLVRNQELKSNYDAW